MVSNVSSKSTANTVLWCTGFSYLHNKNKRPGLWSGGEKGIISKRWRTNSNQSVYFDFGWVLPRVSQLLKIKDTFLIFIVCCVLYWHDLEQTQQSERIRRIHLKNSWQSAFYSAHASSPRSHFILLARPVHSFYITSRRSRKVMHENLSRFHPLSRSLATFIFWALLTPIRRWWRLWQGLDTLHLCSRRYSFFFFLSLSTCRYDERFVRTEVVPSEGFLWRSNKRAFPHSYFEK